MQFKITVQKGASVEAVERLERKLANKTALMDRPSEEHERKQWQSFCRTVAWIVANTGMTWNDVLDLSPVRLKYVASAVQRRRMFDKLAIFEAQAALIDEKSLSRLNSELRDLERD